MAPKPHFRDEETEANLLIQLIIQHAFSEYLLYTRNCRY